VSPAFTGRLAPVVDALTASLAEYGIRLEVEGVWRHDASREHEDASVDAILTTWAADYPDADSFAYGLLHTERGLLGRFSGSVEVDRLAESARLESVAEMRRVLYRRVEEAIAREALLVPLFHPQKYRFARRDVAGLTVTSLSFPVVDYDCLWVRG
jgi:peptide/nickel transport system substrate-binding protein